jgi:poly-gamma-glutamate synthesis protein (capsule biosynthesis protein)
MKKIIAIIVLFLLICSLGIYFFFGFYLIQEKPKQQIKIVTPAEIPTETKKEDKKPEKISMLFVGDMMFDRGVRFYMKEGNEPFKNFEQIKKSVSENIDIISGNLEGPIIETARTNCQQKPYSFQFPESTGELLEKNGFNILNLANNHSNDCYKDGIENTISALNSQNLNYVGYPEIERSYFLTDIKDKKIAMLGIDISIEPIPYTNFLPLIKDLSEHSDILIIQIHWGTEYELNYTERQKTIAYDLINNGADIIIGHHPHVAEPVEIYNNKPIFYSLGNFIFDQHDKDTKIGLAVGINILEDKTEYKVIPVYIETGVPKIIEENLNKNICKRILRDLYKDSCEFEILR